MRRIFILIIFIGLTFPLFAKKTVIKLATLAPDGSEWYYMLVDLGQRWEAATEGRVRLRIYPGGVIGDERDMIRKMRIGQSMAQLLLQKDYLNLTLIFICFLFPCYLIIIRKLILFDLN